MYETECQGNRYCVQYVMLTKDGCTYKRRQTPKAHAVPDTMLHPRRHPRVHSVTRQSRVQAHGAGTTVPQAQNQHNNQSKSKPCRCRPEQNQHMQRVHSNCLAARPSTEKNGTSDPIPSRLCPPCKAAPVSTIQHSQAIAYSFLHSGPPENNSFVPLHNGPGSTPGTAQASHHTSHTRGRTRRTSAQPCSQRPAPAARALLITA